MEKNEIFQKLKSLETDDYQNRGGNYPKSNVPDTIMVNEKPQLCIEAEFKNTDEYFAVKWLENLLNKYNITNCKISSYQTGDYHNDWVTAFAIIK